MNRLKAIINDAIVKIEAEKSTALNTKIALCREQEIKPKFIELDSARNKAVDEKKAEFDKKVADLKAELEKDISVLNEEVERTKKDFEEERIKSVALNVEYEYDTELKKLKEQFDSLPEE